MSIPPFLFSSIFHLSLHSRFNPHLFFLSPSSSFGVISRSTRLFLRCFRNSILSSLSFISFLYFYLTFARVYARQSTALLSLCCRMFCCADPNFFSFFVFMFKLFWLSLLFFTRPQIFVASSFSRGRGVLSASLLSVSSLISSFLFLFLFLFSPFIGPSFSWNSTRVSPRNLCVGGW